MKKIKLQNTYKTDILEVILVCFGQYNKTLPTRWHMNNINLLLTVLGAGNSKIKFMVVFW